MHGGEVNVDREVEFCCNYTFAVHVLSVGLIPLSRAMWPSPEAYVLW